MTMTSHRLYPKSNQKTFQSKKEKVIRKQLEGSPTFVHNSLFCFSEMYYASNLIDKIIITKKLDFLWKNNFGLQQITHSQDHKVDRNEPLFNIINLNPNKIVRRFNL